MAFFCGVLLWRSFVAFFCGVLFFVRSFVGSFLPSFLRSFVRSLVPSFLPSFLPSAFWLFLGSSASVLPVIRCSRRDGYVSFFIFVLGGVLKLANFTQGGEGKGSMVKQITLVASAAVLGGAVSSLAATLYDDNVRATYTKQTYSSAGSVVDVTFKGFSQYGTKVRLDVCTGVFNMVVT